MRHGVAAHHDGDVSGALVRPGMGERVITPIGDDSGQIFMLANRRVAMIAPDPQMHPIPSAVLLGISPDLGDRVVDDPHRFPDDRSGVTRGVRRLVDPRERDEGESRLLGAQTPRDFFADTAIDREPTSDVAAKVGRRSAGNEAESLTYSLSPLQSATDYAQRAETGFRELENRWRGA